MYSYHKFGKISICAGIFAVTDLWLVCHCKFLYRSAAHLFYLALTVYGHFGQISPQVVNMKVLKVLDIHCSTYRKIPIISLVLIFLQKAFLMGLFSGELIFRGACYWREFCASVWVGLDSDGFFLASEDQGGCSDYLLQARRWL